MCFWGNISFLEPLCPELHNTKSSNSFSGTFLTPRRCFLLAPCSHEMNGTSFPSARAGLFSRLTAWLGLESLHGWLASHQAGLAACANLGSLSHSKDLSELHPLSRASQVSQGITTVHRRLQNLKLPQPRVKSLGTTCVCVCSKAGKQGVCSEVSLGKGEVINESGS